MSHTDKSNKDIINELKNGYIEMSGVNLEEANLSLESDNEACQIYEQKLTECE